ncbi:hypothetical protein ALMA_0035 [Alloscardovia macacae]|uniref:Threonine/serine exporter-like N-terminal domain-containing protein n=2 Tax=Alloscardovia macacae TaxID=1160091 RepID=A0A261F6F6_9BIFI|nr:hypothetical protein ALMA_0035 [Alloscardovia macacae]
MVRMNNEQTQTEQTTHTHHPTHRHSIPLDMDDIRADLDTPLADACLAAKTSVIVRTGYLDLSAGTGSYRVKEIMNRIAESLGVYVRADVNLTSIEASCSDGKERVTEVVDLPTVGVNTDRIMLMERFADALTADISARNETLTVREAHARLDAIEKKPRLYGPWMQALGSAVACACFVFLLGGAPYDMLGAFVGAGVGQYVRSRMGARRLNQFLGVGVAVIVAALVTIGTLRLVSFADPSALGHDTAYIGAILFIVPGFPLITGGLDFAKLDFPSGLQRTAYFLCIVGVGTLAAWLVATMVGLSPNGFESPVLPLWLEIALIFVTAIGGVWGFSVLFNSPFSMAFVAAIIGAVADTARLVMVNYGHVSLELGAFLGALIAGLLASAWRISARRGIIPARLGFPRISLTVPSIVIMVPGLYMYRAVYELGNLQTVSALDWMFRAMLVIVGLPIGLALARILTDPRWRYDV